MTVNCKLVCNDYMTQNQSLTFVNCVRLIWKPVVIVVVAAVVVVSQLHWGVVY